MEYNGYNVEGKLVNFLNEKMGKIFDETIGYHPELDLSYIQQEKGFNKSLTDHGWRGRGYKFTNSAGYHCFCSIERYYSIGIEIDNISSHMWDGTIGMLYRCMDEINNIAEEMRKLKGDLEKQEKINEIAKNSAKTWLKEVMKNQTYSYYTTEDENKIMLSIKMKNRVQLDIPIYYKRFQKIIPKLLETIQQFENTANKSNVKVLISNSRHNQQWKTK